MTDRELDHIIRKLLKDYQPETDLSGWDRFEERLDQEMLEDTLFDNSIRASLGTYTFDGTGNWDRMEQALTHEESVFDNEVKEKVEAFEAPYDPATWPVLKEKVTEDERLRRRIIMTKVLEIVAILIAFITVYNFFPAIQTTVIEPTEQFVREKWGQQDQAQVTPADEAVQLSALLEDSPKQQVVEKAQLTVPEVILTDEGSPVNTVATGPASPTQPGAQNIVVVDDNGTAGKAGADIAHQEKAITDHGIANPNDDRIDPAVAENVVVLDMDDLENDVTLTPARKDIARFATLATLDSDLQTGPRNPSLGLDELELHRKPGLRFSISASTEINQLYIPADHFYSLGRQVSFTEKDMTAIGYSAGASVLFDHEVFTFETGLHYSQKSYHPNRILHIGETFDVRTLDFKNISLSVLSVPLQIHWNFDRSGKTRLYAVGGVSMNLIATAHYDLISTNNFRSSAAPTDPSYNKTSQEVQRIREHILDDAEFSAKSFLTVNAGFGIERLINHKFSVFVQPTGSFQIPFFHISDQNGKHLQYVSAQIGTRIRLR